MSLTTIPDDFGEGGANLAPGGAAGFPTLAAVLQEHKTVLDDLAAGASGADLIARFATTGNVNLSTTGLTVIDGVTPVAGDIALVKSQTTGSQNGLYVVAAPAWSRLKDAGGADVVKPGLLVQVTEGTANADLLFACTTDAPITVGTTAVAFATSITASLSSATPAAVAAAGAAGSAATGSKSDHAHADPNRAAAGTNLTDTATQTIQITGGNWRKLPTLSQGGTLTVGTTGAVAGDQLQITRTSTDAFTYAIVNGGVGAGTIVTLPASKVSSALLQYDGTNWILRSIGQLA